MTEPHDLSVVAAAAEIAAGRLTAEALVESCLARIAEREPTVGAWNTAGRSPPRGPQAPWSIALAGAATRSFGQAAIL